MLDSGKNLKEYIDRMIDEKISQLPLSFPCKVLSQNGNKVQIQTLLPITPLDLPREIPIMESPYLSFPIMAGDIGLAIACSYVFEKATQDEPINEKIPSIKENGLVFIPLVPKSKYKGENGKTILYDQTQTHKVSLDNQGNIEVKNASAGLKLETAGMVELKGASASVGKLLNDIATLLSAMVKTPLAGNGAPMSGGNPKLEVDIATLTTNIKANFK